MSCAYVGLQPIYAWAASEMLWWIIWTQFSGYKWLYYPLVLGYGKHHQAYVMNHGKCVLLKWVCCILSFACKSLQIVFHCAGALYSFKSFLSTKWKPSPRTAKMHTLLLYLIGKNRKNSTTLCRIFQNSKVQSQMHNEIRESYIFCHVIQFWFVVCVPSSKF